MTFGNSAYGNATLGSSESYTVIIQEQASLTASTIQDIGDIAVANETSSIIVSAAPTIGGAINATRDAVTTGGGSVVSLAELAEVFETESSADLSFDLVTEPVLGFASEWVYEERDIEGADSFSLVLDIRHDGDVEIVVQYSENDDGTADYTTDSVTVSRDNQVVTFPELGDDGYYRIIISGMQPETFLRAITWGPTRF